MVTMVIILGSLVILWASKPRCSRPYFISSHLGNTFADSGAEDPPTDHPPPIDLLLLLSLSIDLHTSKWRCSPSSSLELTKPSDKTHHRLRILGNLGSLRGYSVDYTTSSPVSVTRMWLASPVFFRALLG
ncbi:hypothetical protein Vadar_021968 [Vaccinium darrowii]|uniref:Uncharacterized protein n=1 Tax=Vaccinium darrowii TaxID=229202 RepID=A0ACB7Y0P7_9ERIC|nr:hypothetical protein Vadar_021968 [Vaccinium darrowii]